MSLNLYYVFKRAQDRYRYELYNAFEFSEGSCVTGQSAISGGGIDIGVKITSGCCDDKAAAGRDAKGRRVAEEIYVRDTQELFLQFQKYNVEVLRQYFDAEFAEFRYRKCENHDLSVKIIAAIKNEFAVILDLKLKEFLVLLEALLRDTLCITIKIELEEVLKRFVLQIERTITVIVEKIVVQIKTDLEAIRILIAELKVMIDALCKKKLQLNGKLCFEASAECEAECSTSGGASVIRGGSGISSIRY